MPPNVVESTLQHFVANPHIVALTIVPEETMITIIAKLKLVTTSLGLISPTIMHKINLRSRTAILRQKHAYLRAQTLELRNTT